ncbi:hypothetical protein TIFTF001_015447 [Ficus carica]|uniref:Uncharacterized protein n=1 Tax=Ficus carica TaxID=3494 RepID=A0AA88ASD9_FICCA|nr:hypothetical protein TIFTF001_015447 [Ficus carica]
MAKSSRGHDNGSSTMSDTTEGKDEMAKIDSDLMDNLIPCRPRWNNTQLMASDSGNGMQPSSLKHLSFSPATIITQTPSLLQHAPVKNETRGWKSNLKDEQQCVGVFLITLFGDTLSHSWIDPSSSSPSHLAL